jgi:EAL domain-containing protein (putative c-di-GMP-specific phosphodiesterase class I)
LKIDQSFIAAMVESPKGAAMVRTMIHMGRQLNLEIIAEGVELEEQFDALRRLHCQQVQGFYFSHPFDAETISTFLTEWAGDRTSLLQSMSSLIPADGLPQLRTVVVPT